MDPHVAILLLLRTGFLPVRAWSSTVLVRTGAGGAVPASGRYQVVQYGGHRGTGSTGTETVLKRICCLRLQGKHIFVRVTSFFTLKCGILGQCRPLDTPNTSMYY